MIFITSKTFNLISTWHFYLLRTNNNHYGLSFFFCLAVHIRKLLWFVCYTNAQTRLIHLWWRDIIWRYHRRDRAIFTYWNWMCFQFACVFHKIDVFFLSPLVCLRFTEIKTIFLWVDATHQLWLLVSRFENRLSEMWWSSFLFFVYS